MSWYSHPEKTVPQLSRWLYRRYRSHVVSLTAPADLVALES